MGSVRSQRPRCLDPELIVPISRKSTRDFQTGAWSQKRPRFLERPSPCSALCPNGNPIPNAMHCAAKGDWDGALKAFLEESPLPAVCGRVCDHPCQGACNRIELEGPVQVRQVERAAAEFGLAEPRLLSRAGRAFPVAVVGSGPAGLAAAYHLARMGHPVHLLEARDRLGGLLDRGIPWYRLPPESWRNDLDRILSLGLRVSLGTKLDAAGLEALLGDHAAVFLAIGAQAHRLLGLPGEGLENVLAGLDYLCRPELQGLAKGASVLVIGGGNTAVDAARVALRRGAREVLLLYRRGKEEMPAFREEIRDAEEEGVRLQFRVGPMAFLGKEGRVEALRYAVMRAAGPGRAPEPDRGSEEEVSCDLVLLATGQELEGSDLLRGLDTQAGRVWVDGFGRTSRDRLLAGGDMTPQRAAVVDAMASGKRAAATIHLALTRIAGPKELLGLSLGQESAFSLRALIERPTAAAPAGVAPLAAWARLTASHCEPAALPRPSPLQRVQGLDEVAEGLGLDQAQAEAHRCFCCGTCVQCDQCQLFCPEGAMLQRDDAHRAYEAEPDHCKGCGACATVCARGVMTFGEAP